MLVNITQIIDLISAKIKAEEKIFKAFTEFFCFAYNDFLFPFTLSKKMFSVKLKRSTFITSVRSIFITSENQYAGNEPIRKWMESLS